MTMDSMDCYIGTSRFANDALQNTTPTSPVGQISRGTRRDLTVDDGLQHQHITLH
ncbi:hypothetical protein [Marinomonas polaris]|uniref:hypothetical protein n=1 Tax=Marinomonas polaris TaxID=293552 RepID=UPI003F9BFB17